MSKPCHGDKTWCQLADYLGGCWRKGLGPDEQDETKCPRTAAEFDAEWERICDVYIARGRRSARRVAKAVRGIDGRD